MSLGPILHVVTSRLHVVVEKLRWFVGRVAEPLRGTGGLGAFGPSIPGTRTTTADGDTELTKRLRAAGRSLRRIVDRIVDPLRADDDLENFRLSIPETHTTTIDGDTGWATRPPAQLRCRQCDSEIRHSDPRDVIDCPRCVAEFDPDEFPDLELLYLECPVCRNRMEHGQRHPDRLDVPEWATCHDCRYHWEFKHSF
jgi:Zn finger protein HypA/HybF involved in hydrogenase expression